MLANKVPEHNYSPSAILDDRLEKIKSRLDRYILKMIVLPPLLPLIFLVFAKQFTFNWSWVIAPLAFMLLDSIFQINRNYLIDLNKSEKDGVLVIIYYNFLEKVKEEVVPLDKIQLVNYQKSKSKTIVTFTDNRQLKLNHLRKVTHTFGSNS